MRICRRDLEFMLKVMDKFDLTHDSDSVRIRYETENEILATYRLYVSFTDVQRNVLCNIEVEIEQDMFDGE